MAEKNIQEGDDVSWKWGGGNPSGTVAEVKTDGQLEIESKGKLVHKNADPSNPAVHVERSGNDVVKRASELTKLDSYGEEDNPAESTAPGKKDAAPATEETSATDGTDPVANGKGPLKKRGSRKKSDAAATIGDKREAEGEAGAVEGATEEATGTKAKKAKTAKTANGEKKISGRTKKDSKAKKAQEEQTHADGKKMEIDAHAGEGATAPKKRGRPKKSDASDHAPSGDAPAAHTRSKE
ncbi:hypothetical protein H0H87_001264 [Tephrocybe sp. NHM501043]|nr:hypothetical protein H0H87_001264 [Tephrocybe sp. NHM501043]